MQINEKTYQILIRDLTTKKNITKRCQAFDVKEIIAEYNDPTKFYFEIHEIKCIARNSKDFDAWLDSL